MFIGVDDFLELLKLFDFLLNFRYFGERNLLNLSFCWRVAWVCPEAFWRYLEFF